MLTAAGADRLIMAPRGPQLEPGQLLAEHDAFVASLPCRSQAKYLRRRGEKRLLAAHPDLQAWMARPVADRLGEAHCLQAWPLLSWCFATGRLIPELDLLAGKHKGGHFSLWVLLHPDDMRRVHQAAAGFEWCPEWRTRITDNAFPLACLTRAITLEQLTVEDLDAVEDAISSATMLTRTHRQHWLTQHRGVRTLCYQLGLVDDPPVHANVRVRSPEQRAAGIAQPEIRRVVARYLTTIAASLRPATVTGRAASLAVFAGWLAESHPEVSNLRSLTARCWRRSARSTPPASAGVAAPDSTGRSRSAITPTPSLTCGASSTISPLGGGPNVRPGCCCTAATSPGCRRRCPEPCQGTSTPH